HGRTAPGSPMMALLERARRLREQPGVVNASLTVGFPWADVANAGPAVLVTVIRHGEADPRPAAIELAQALWDTHESTRLGFPGPKEAMAAARSGRRPSQSRTPINRRSSSSREFGREFGWEFGDTHESTHL